MNIFQAVGEEPPKDYEDLMRKLGNGKKYSEDNGDKTTALSLEMCMVIAEITREIVIDEFGGNDIADKIKRALQ